MGIPNEFLLKWNNFKGVSDTTFDVFRKNKRENQFTSPSTCNGGNALYRFNGLFAI